MQHHKNFSLLCAISFILILTQLFSSLAFCETGKPCKSCQYDFAIYNPDYEDDGVWEEEVTALEHIFKTFNWTSKSIDHNQISDGALGKNQERKFRGLIGPGGWSWYRESVIPLSGEENIRDFVKSGGHYVGFCAGAYWAASRLVMAMEASGSNGSYSLAKDYSANFPYQLSLYKGDAKGPLGWMPWKNGTNVNLSLAEINLKNPVMNEINLPKQSRFLYGGGPFFPGAHKIPGMQIWARAKSELSDQSPETGEDQPTIIHYPFGSGTVTLFSYHPDVLIKHQADGIKLSQFFDEDKIKWNPGQQTFEEINLNSWNIVHAALQIASDRKVTGLKSLSKD